MKNKYYTWLLEADSFEKKWRKKAETFLDYFDGEQWTDEEKDIIESRNQQPTVINMISPLIEMMTSLELQTKSDIQCVGRESDDHEKAVLYTKLLKHTFDNSNFDFYHSQAFLKSLITGRSALEVKLEKDDLNKNKIIIDLLNWEDIFIDPFSRKPDGSDAKFIAKIKYLNREDAKNIFYEKANEIQNWFDETNYNGQEKEANLKFEIDTKQDRICICEMWFKVFESDKIKIRYTCFAGEKLLIGDENGTENTLDIDEFPIVPVFCDKTHKGTPKGVVEMLISLQDQVNKLNSKFLWELSQNKYIMEESAVSDIEEFRDEANRPDGMLVVRDGKLNSIRNVDKFRDLSYLSNHLNFQIALLQKTSGINDSMLGVGGNGERSGVMQDARIRQGAAMISRKIENLFFSKLKIAKIVLKAIGKHYTDKRIIRIVDPNTQKEEYITINGEVTDQQSGKKEMMNNVEDSLYYDVVLNRTNPFNTVNHQSLIQLTEILKAGILPPQVAGKLVVMLSDIPNKQDLLNELINEQQMQMQAQSGMQQ